MKGKRCPLLSSGFLFLSGFFLLSPFSIRAEIPYDRVVVVSVDGLRADAATGRFMPNLVRCASEGASAADARCEAPAYTVPNHVSMVTGLSPVSHGFTSNFNLFEKPPKGTLFRFLKEAGLTVGVYLSKEKLRLLARPDQVSRLVVMQEGHSESVVGRFVRDVGSPETRWRFSFIHLSEPDVAGHRHGWMSQSYVNAVFAADAQIGRIRRALTDAGLWEKTLFIVLSDHGGQGRDHGESGLMEDFRIPWVAVGPGIPPGLIIRRPVSTKDLAPTVLAAFGLHPPVSMEGSAVVELFESGQPAMDPAASLSGS